MSVFHNGALKKECLNYNYRGLVGWDCYNHQDKIKSKLVCINSGECMDDTLSGTFGVDWLEIPEFSLVDIPNGELCWVTVYSQCDRGYSFELMQLKTFVRESVGSILASSYYTAVPYIMAETPDRAEELKWWWK